MDGDRKQFDLIAGGFIEDLHLLKRDEERSDWDWVREYVQSLDERGRRDLISDYQNLARKQMAILRGHAETMVTLCQLREVDIVSELDRANRQQAVPPKPPMQKRGGPTR